VSRSPAPSCPRARRRSTPPSPGAPAAYACCRPPGHHATRTSFGGSCYLNNTAAAAARLGAGLDGSVAVIDVDAHHAKSSRSTYKGGLGPYYLAQFMREQSRTVVTR
jgi:hypothetical protein